MTRLDLLDKLAELSNEMDELDSQQKVILNRQADIVKEIAEIRMQLLSKK